jgi:hypothetical protein
VRVQVYTVILAASLLVLGSLVGDVKDLVEVLPLLPALFGLRYAALPSKKEATCA